MTMKQPSTLYPGLPAWLDKYPLTRVEWRGVAGYFGILPTSKISPNRGQVEGLPANPRRWTREEIDRLKKSITETPELTLARGVLAYPLEDPVELVALGGNMRHAAAKSLKEKNLPVFIYPVDTPADKLMEIVAKDNGTFGEWDMDALANEWSDKPLVDWGVPAWEQRNAEQAQGTGGTGGGGEQHQCENKEDNTDGMTVEKRAFPGAIFALDGHRLMCGDATDAQAVKDLLHSGMISGVDLILTDPPYGINVVPKSGKLGGQKDAETEIARARRHGLGSPESCAIRKYRPVIGDATTETARKALEALKGVAKAVIVFGGNYFTEFLPPSKCWAIWDKGVYEGLSFADVEMAWTNINKTASLFKHTWCGITRAGDTDAEGRTRLHPTQKPVGLLTAIVERLAPGADTILDTFAGSGSTLIAAERLGKRCFAMELSVDYVDIILARWERFTGKKAELLNPEAKASQGEK